MKISVIMPVYNEFRTFDEVLRRVRRAPLPAGCEKEIIVVDDGSTDGTTGRLSEHERAGLVVGHYAPTNLGKGAAIRSGIALASGDVVIIQDGDLEYDPEDYPKIITPIVAGECEVVYGSRFRGRITGMQWHHRLANWILTRTANLLYGARLTDEATAYKAFRSPILQQLDLRCRGFEFCAEVTAKLCRLGYRIREVPIDYDARRIAHGKKIRIRDGVIAFWTLLKYRLPGAAIPRIAAHPLGSESSQPCSDVPVRR